MPKTNTNDAVTPGWRVEVSWRAADEIEGVDTPGHVQLASVNLHSPFEFPATSLTDDNGTASWTAPEAFDGWRVTLDAAGIDRVIESLLQARRAAFGPEVAAPATLADALERVRVGYGEALDVLGKS